MVPLDQSQVPNLEIAHVLFMDIIAYSKLPMDEQQKVLRQLQESVRGTEEFARAQAKDELIRLPTGDGMALVFFTDPEAPVRCALELSHTLRDHPEIPLRMGIHSGPVYRVADINANRNVAGGGINIAQRVMDCGDAGHILVSGAVAEVLGQLSAWSNLLHDLGDVEVKHGVRLHLYNLYKEEAGNPELPQKLCVAQKVEADKLLVSARRKIKLGAVVAGVVAMLGIGGFIYTHRAHALTEKDTIVLTDFTNTTGDAVFDGTLGQGLAVQLEQSPFLSLVSDERIQQTLRLMGQPADARLTRGIAREVCQRTGSKAIVAGSISSLGSQYVISLNAVNCNNGDSLAKEQAQAAGKEDVLRALGKAATSLRGKLGESLSTVQKFDTPVEQATTSSLEALQAYSLGQKTISVKVDYVAAMPFFQRAIRLDPNFAMAYARLGVVYWAIGETRQGVENGRKAYELREHVSEREKFDIESRYYYVLGDLEKARQVDELWAQTYPRDRGPRISLGYTYGMLGQFDKGLAEIREAHRLEAGALTYVNLVRAYLPLNRLEEARTTAEEAQAKKLDSPRLRSYLYDLAFLQNDAEGMAQQVAWSMGKPGAEDVLLNKEAYTAGYFGRPGRARELSLRAMALAERTERMETAATYEADAALREALFGNAVEARQRATAALRLSTGWPVQYEAALALAFAGDAARAQALADDLGKRFPEHTIVRFSYLPTIHAQLALIRHDSSKAIEVLQAATPYELGSILYPVYVRGEAYLAAHQGGGAAAEFQKILDHRGIVKSQPIGALAHLGLARAYALQGETPKARTAYQDFFALWKDADPDIPILQQAKAEYAKLK